MRNCGPISPSFLVSSVLIAYNVLHLYANVAKSFEISFFQVSNIITTTGFGYGTTEKWPLFSVHPLDADGHRWFCWIDRWGLKVIRCLTLWRIAKKSGSFDLVSESRSDLACQ